MKLSIWMDLRRPTWTDETWASVYSHMYDYAAFAEEAGFDSVWISEHHATDDGYCPAPLVVLAAIAARTERIGLGTAIIQAPLVLPLRFAEECLVLDQLSGGRLSVGLGIGYREVEFAAARVSTSDRVALTENLVRVLQESFTGSVTVSGPDREFTAVAVAPSPFRPEGIPIYLGGGVAASARRAARLGCHFMPDLGADPAFVGVYRDLLAEGTPLVGTGLVATNRVVYVSDSVEQGRDELRESLLYQYNVYRRWFAESGDHQDWGSEADDLDEVLNDRYLIGPPEVVLEGLAQVAAEGVDEVMFWARPPGLAHELAMASLRRVATEILPQVHALS
jgi:alkanesulfonate monooxygenase SsuD/methylene tetrahydromethanopterin reductase-like flavin-dependent oxidoreductase (luciferase family)